MPQGGEMEAGTIVGCHSGLDATDAEPICETPGDQGGRPGPRVGPIRKVDLHPKVLGAPTLVQVGDDGIDTGDSPRDVCVRLGRKIGENDDGVDAGKAQGLNLAGGRGHGVLEGPVVKYVMRQGALDPWIHQPNQAEASAARRDDAGGLEKARSLRLDIRGQKAEALELLLQVEQRGGAEAQLELEGNHDFVAQTPERAHVDSGSLPCIETQVPVLGTQVDDQRCRSTGLRLGHKSSDQGRARPDLAEIKRQFEQASPVDIYAIHFALLPGRRIGGEGGSRFLDEVGGFLLAQVRAIDGGSAGPKVGKVRGRARILAEHGQKVASGGRFVRILKQQGVSRHQRRHLAELLRRSTQLQKSRKVVVVGLVRGQEDGDAGGPPARVTDEFERSLLLVRAFGEKFVLVLTAQGAKGAEAPSRIDQRQA